MSEELIKLSDAIKAIQYSNLDILNAEERVALIKTIPTIEPKQGEWIPIGQKRSVFECSKCGTIKRFNSNFCPNCGADMRGAENE